MLTFRKIVSILGWEHVYEYSADGRVASGVGGALHESEYFKIVFILHRCFFFKCLSNKFGNLRKYDSPMKALVLLTYSRRPKHIPPIPYILNNKEKLFF